MIPNTSMHGKTTPPEKLGEVIDLAAAGKRVAPVHDQRHDGACDCGGGKCHGVGRCLIDADQARRRRPLCPDAVRAMIFERGHFSWAQVHDDDVVPICVATLPTPELPPPGETAMLRLTTEGPRCRHPYVIVSGDATRRKVTVRPCERWDCPECRVNNLRYWVGIATHDFRDVYAGGKTITRWSVSESDWERLHKSIISRAGGSCIRIAQPDGQFAVYTDAPIKGEPAYASAAAYASAVEAVEALRRSLELIPTGISRSRHTAATNTDTRKAVTVSGKWRQPNRRRPISDTHWVITAETEYFADTYSAGEAVYAWTGPKADWRALKVSVATLTINLPTDQITVYTTAHLPGATRFADAASATVALTATLKSAGTSKVIRCHGSWRRPSVTGMRRIGSAPVSRQHVLEVCARYWVDVIDHGPDLPERKRAFAAIDIAIPTTWTPERLMRFNADILGKTRKCPNGPMGGDDSKGHSDSGGVTSADLERFDANFNPFGWRRRPRAG